MKSFWTNISEVDRAWVEEGWDGDDSIPTNSKCISASSRLAEYLDENEIPGALVIPDDFGGLVFVWKPFELKGYYAQVHVGRFGGYDLSMRKKGNVYLAHSDHYQSEHELVADMMRVAEIF